MAFQQKFQADKDRVIPPQNKLTMPPSNGEIHYLWYYIQGSIMNGDVRCNLCNSWGFCERHAWIAIQVEASLRHCFMMGPAILYEDLLDRCMAAFKIRGPLKNRQLLRNLREKGPCLMCNMDLGPETKGIANKGLVERGRDLTEVRRLAEMGRPYWEETVCGSCLGNGSWQRCRPHLIQDILLGNVDHLAPHHKLINKLRHHIVLYSRSFEWEHRGTATHEDKASLISAVGWFSGWRPFISIVGITNYSAIPNEL
jgi:hypothetical protein